jgi:thiol-disulfide isomerase/thioredoxin
MNNQTPDQPQADLPDPILAKRKKVKTWTRRGLEVLIFIVIIMGVRTWQQRDVVKGEAPALSGLMLDGNTYAMVSRPAQPVLVHFWATWCPICRAELGSIDSLAKNNPNVITVAMQSGSKEEVRQYLSDKGVSFPVVNDADQKISARWGVQAVPASFIVDTEGKIRYVEIGYTTEIGLRIRLWLAGL